MLSFRQITLLFIVSTALFSSGCARTYSGQFGAGVGAIGGAAVGAANAANPAVGAAAGALVGGVVGAILGDYSNYPYWYGYRACRNCGGFYSRGICFASPYEASAYWEAKAGLYQRDITEQQRAERWRGRAQAFEGYRPPWQRR